MSKNGKRKQKKPGVGSTGTEIKGEGEKEGGEQGGREKEGRCGQ